MKATSTIYLKMAWVECSVYYIPMVSFLRLFGKEERLESLICDILKTKYVRSVVGFMPFIPFCSPF
jgi:hypothetical protein